MLNTNRIKFLLNLLFVLFFLIIVDRLAGTQEKLGYGLLSIINSYINWFKNNFILDLIFTLLRVFCGFIIASIFGILIGLFTGRYVKLLEGVIHILNYLRAITPVALAPFFLVFFGISEISKILLVAWGAFFPIWVNSYLSIIGLSEDMKDSAKLQGLSKFNLFRHFYLPATISGAYPGARIAIGISFILVFISETLGADYGIGYQLKLAYDTLQINRMTAALLLLGALGLLADKLFVFISNNLAPWLKYERNENYG